MQFISFNIHMFVPQSDSSTHMCQTCSKMLSLKFRKITETTTGMQEERVALQIKVDLIWFDIWHTLQLYLSQEIFQASTLCCCVFHTPNTFSQMSSQENRKTGGKCCCIKEKLHSINDPGSETSLCLVPGSANKDREINWPFRDWPNPFTRECWNPMTCTVDILLFTWRMIMRSVH